MIGTILFPSSGRAGGADGKPLHSLDPIDSASAGRKSVLVVEDEWYVSIEIQAALEDAGYRVPDVAVTADEAVSMAEIHRPDLVVMDIRLRGRRDGIEAAMEISRRLGLRCLFVSAHVDPGTRERGAAADPVGWLSKPFSSAQLVHAVENAFRDL